MTYKEKLQSPQWQKKRLEIFQRDEFRCVHCGAEDKQLHVHHVVYRKIDPWAYADHCYQTLCASCHEFRQGLTDKAVDALRMAVKDVHNQRLERVCQFIITRAMEVI